jgi:hypothetical protein
MNKPKPTSDKQPSETMEFEATPGDSTGAMVAERVKRNKLIERGILTSDQVKRFLALSNNKEERNSPEMFKVELETTCSDYPYARLGMVNEWEQSQIL